MSRTDPGDFLSSMLRLQRDIVRERMSRRRTAILERLAEEKEEPPDFAAALTMPSGGRVNIIAEMKKASPSAGVIREAFEPLYLARRAVQAGAAAISVLTEEKYFQGSLEDLARVAAGVPAPVMRKDFIIDPYQLLEARVSGAAACLLIADMLEFEHLESLLRDTNALAMTALVEVHDEAALDRALEAGASVVGVNNRNLKTLEVDTEMTYRLRERIPGDRVLVSESGHRTRKDLERLEREGVHAVLIGEAIMRAEDVGAAVRELRGDAAAPPGLEPAAG
jgi:indole-3-glycerol phosphate synthase